MYPNKGFYSIPNRQASANLRLSSSTHPPHYLLPSPSSSSSSSSSSAASSSIGHLTPLLFSVTILLLFHTNTNRLCNVRLVLRSLFASVEALGLLMSRFFYKSSGHVERIVCAIMTPLFRYNPFIRFSSIFALPCEHSFIIEDISLFTHVSKLFQKIFINSHQKLRVFEVLIRFFLYFFAIFIFIFQFFFHSLSIVFPQT